MRRYQNDEDYKRPSRAVRAYQLRQHARHVKWALFPLTVLPFIMAVIASWSDDPAWNGTTWVSGVLAVAGYALYLGLKLAEDEMS